MYMYGDTVIADCLEYRSIDGLAIYCVSASVSRDKQLG